MSDHGSEASQSHPSCSRAPMFVLHTPAVDFIENKMSEYHPAFNTSGFRYSPTQSQFVPLAGPAVILHVPGPSTLAPPAAPALPQPRPIPGSISDMGFWAEVFPEAMDRLNQEPLPDRPAADYDFHNSQRVGKYRRKLRSVMDKAAVPFQQVVKGIPDMDITSPVISVIDLLLDAYRQAAEVRETVNSGFDNLPEAFEKIDFFFKSYPEDQNIFRVSVQLVLAIFRAIEEAIKFYSSAQAKRAGLAILTGEQYQQKLTQSMNEISACSNTLGAHAHMSFTHRMISGHMPLSCTTIGQLIKPLGQSAMKGKSKELG
ncbi:hypothetical protein F5Y19DRAFT_489877 [Xylariaceae sp. FL1651]|nr:hypothetical protein F5Y19DRAFT_489877 [Xylariaceae sp. FL1651]